MFISNGYECTRTCPLNSNLRWNVAVIDVFIFNGIKLGLLFFRQFRQVIRIELKFNGSSSHFFHGGLPSLLKWIGWFLSEPYRRQQSLGCLSIQLCSSESLYSLFGYLLVLACFHLERL